MVAAAACPDCGTELIKDCPACHAPIESAMQVECRSCGTPLRAAELFGVPIRRKPGRAAAHLSSTSTEPSADPSAPAVTVSAARA